VRRFTCEGSALGCRILLVGANAAMDVEFWPYWDSSYGFRKSEWLQPHRALRQARINAASGFDS
jgi:hypothetical protein